MDELRDKVAAEIHWVGRFMEGDKYAITNRILAIPEIREALALFGPDLTDTPAKDINQAIAPRAQSDS